jgi:hypothetical protein
MVITTKMRAHKVWTMQNMFNLKITTTGVGDEISCSQSTDALAMNSRLLVR